VACPVLSLALTAASLTLEPGLCGLAGIFVEHVVILLELPVVLWQRSSLWFFGRKLLFAKPKKGGIVVGDGVENAVQHGIQSSPKAVRLCIAAQPNQANTGRHQLGTPKRKRNLRTLGSGGRPNTPRR
jgi:hypothetical protein